MKYILIIIILVCALAIVYITYYNLMQYLKTKIEHAEGIIDETLRVRYDNLLRANDIVKNILKDDKEYFKEYINLKNKNLTNFEFERKIKEGVNLLSKFRDDYKEIQNNKEIKEIVEIFRSTDERLSATISYYNKNTNELNGLIRKFPSLIVAKIHGFKIKPFFDGKDMTDEVYNDFKIK